MNTIHFAIASIVDANTGYRRLHSAEHIDYGLVEREGPATRSHSLRAIFGLLRNKIAGLIERGREQAARRRQLNQLAALSDRSLRDIGLHRGDIYALESGQISLVDLHRGRRQRSQRELGRLETHSLALPRAAVNDHSAGATRCA
ncbi:MAG: DUF1127 domain-containing protein [Gammaproteobacteria bacterium]|nr:DUF1127 domain-containing protein [Gammaproteobacteria bacterium]